jgi:capsular exopolysaccharide synthesis family protein
MYPSNSPALPNGPALPSRELTVRELISRLARRKWSVVITTAIFVAIGVAVSLLMDPAYRSDIEVTLDTPPPTSSFNPLQDPLNVVSMPNSTTDLLSQVELMQSFDVLSKAFEQNNVRLPPPGSDEAGPAVDVKPVGQSSTVIISVTTNDPGASQSVVATIPDAYNQVVSTVRRKQVEGVITNMQDRLKAQQATLAQDEKQLDILRVKEGITGTDSDLVDLLGRVSRAQENMNQADIALAGAQQRFQERQIARSNASKSVGEKTSIGARSDIEQQRTRVSELKAQLAHLMVIYTPGSPDVKAAQAELRSQQQRLNDVIASSKRYVDTTNPQVLEFESRLREASADLQAARAAASTAKLTYTQANAKLESYRTKLPDLTTLRRRIESDALTVQMSQRNLEDLLMRSRTVKPAATVIGQATIPQRVRPRWLLNLALSFAFGILFSLGIVSLREQLDDRVSSAGKAYEVSGLTPLSYLPRAAGATQALPDRTKMTSGLLARYRMLRYNVLFSVRPKVAKSIMVAGSRAGTDRTSTAVNLALSMAHDNLKVVLLDANVAEGSLSKQFKTPRSPGLTEVLSGTAQLADVLQATSVEGIQLLPAGSEMSNSLELLSSPKMAEILESLRATVDFVVIDTPPVLNSVEASIMGSVADVTIYVAQLGVTRTEDLRRGTDLLRTAGAHVVGVAFTNARGEVDPTIDMSL